MGAFEFRHGRWKRKVRFTCLRLGLLATAVPLTTSARAEAPAPSERSVPRDAPADRRSRTFAVAAAGRVATGILPQVHFGAALRASQRWGQWSARGDGFVLPARTFRMSGAPHPVRTAAWGASLGGCRLFFAPGMNTGICASLQGASVLARERPPDGSPGDGGTAFWFALMAGVEGTIGLVPRLGLFWAAEGLIPLVRPHYVLTDGTAVAQGTFGFQGDLGLQASF